MSLRPSAFCRPSLSRPSFATGRLLLFACVGIRRRINVIHCLPLLSFRWRVRLLAYFGCVARLILPRGTFVPRGAAFSFRPVCAFSDYYYRSRTAARLYAAVRALLRGLRVRVYTLGCTLRLDGGLVWLVRCCCCAIAGTLPLPSSTMPVLRHYRLFCLCLEMDGWFLILVGSPIRCLFAASLRDRVLYGVLDSAVPCTISRQRVVRYVYILVQLRFVSMPVISVTFDLLCSRFAVYSAARTRFGWRRFVPAVRVLLAFSAFRLC